MVRNFRRSITAFTNQAGCFSFPTVKLVARAFNFLSYISGARPYFHCCVFSPAPGFPHPWSTGGGIRLVAIDQGCGTVTPQNTSFQRVPPWPAPWQNPPPKGPKNPPNRFSHGLEPQEGPRNGGRKSRVNDTGTRTPALFAEEPLQKPLTTT